MIAFIPADVAWAYNSPTYPSPAIHSPAPVAASHPRLPVSSIGTGGIASEAFYLNQFGYKAVILEVHPYRAVREMTPFAEVMREIKNGFGRTMTRLPEVFGVSRQTLYNWLGGETPKIPHREKLQQLVEVARMFSERGFKPTPIALDRTVADGKSLLQLLAEGADGRDTAEKFMRIVQRGEHSKAKLDELLGGRRTRPGAADFGAPALDEIS
jgi:transcriptional regulator with XRE-family HTH domain